MDNQLISTIERLKETLAGVASARQQVGDTVAAYGRTQKDIQAFVERMGAIEAALTDVVSLLNANRAALGGLTDKAAQGIGAACDAAAANAGRAIGDATTSALAPLAAATDSLRTQVDSLASSLAAQAEAACGSLTSSVTGLDASAARIDDHVTALARQAEELNTAARQVAASAAHAVADCRNQLATVATSLAHQADDLHAATVKIAAIAAAVDDCRSQQETIAADLAAVRSDVAALRKAQAEELSALCDAAKRNMRIGIATLVLVISLSVIFAFLALATFGFVHC